MTVIKTKETRASFSFVYVLLSQRRSHNTWHETSSLENSIGSLKLLAGPARWIGCILSQISRNYWRSKTTKIQSIGMLFFNKDAIKVKCESSVSFAFTPLVLLKKGLRNSFFSQINRQIHFVYKLQEKNNHWCKWIESVSFTCFIFFYSVPIV